MNHARDHHDHEPTHAAHDGGGHAGEHAPAGARVHAGHDKHAGHTAEMFRKKFWGTLALSIPTLVWAPMLQHWFHYTAPTFPGARLIPAVFGTGVYFYGGWVFIRGAKAELEARLP